MKIKDFHFYHLLPLLFLCFGLSWSSRSMANYLDSPAYRQYYEDKGNLKIFLVDGNDDPIDGRIFSLNRELLQNDAYFNAMMHFGGMEVGEGEFVKLHLHYASFNILVNRLFLGEKYLKDQKPSVDEVLSLYEDGDYVSNEALMSLAMQLVDCLEPDERTVLKIIRYAFVDNAGIFPLDSEIGRKLIKKIESCSESLSFSTQEEIRQIVNEPDFRPDLVQVLKKIIPTQLPHGEVWAKGRMTYMEAFLKEKVAEKKEEYLSQMKAAMNKVIAFDSTHSVEVTIHSGKWVLEGSAPGIHVREFNSNGGYYGYTDLRTLKDKAIVENDFDSYAKAKALAEFAETLNQHEYVVKFHPKQMYQDDSLNTLVITPNYVSTTKKLSCKQEVLSPEPPIPTASRTCCGFF